MIWIGGLYVYFSVWIQNVFNLTIIVFYIGEKFSFCAFCGSGDIYGGVLSGCKICPYVVTSMFVICCVVVFNKIYISADFVYFYKRYLELYL